MRFHFVFFKGGLETLNYFSTSMCRRDYDILLPDSDVSFDTYLADLTQPDALSCEAFDAYIRQENCIAFLFNQIGLFIEDGSGHNIWEKYDIPVYTMIVDHPRNFADAFREPVVKDLHVIVLDHRHEEFIHDFYPKIRHIYFMPNGGMPVSSDVTPWKERDIDLLYTGDCQMDRNSFEPLPFLPENGRSFYTDCISMFLEDPLLTAEDAIDCWLTNNFSNCPSEERSFLMFQTSFELEQKIRCYYKQEVMHALDDAGFAIEIYGNNWEQEGRTFSERTHIHSRVSSEVCNRLVGQAKISLNFQPWYKDGCSERVFNNLLNGALCVTDESGYLTGRFTDGKELVFFDLRRPDFLVERLQYLLQHPEEAARIADCGRRTAFAHDTWPHRMREVLILAANDLRTRAEQMCKDVVDLEGTFAGLSFEEALTTAVQYAVNNPICFEIPDRVHPDYVKWQNAKKLQTILLQEFSNNGKRYMRLELINATREK